MRSVKVTATRQTEWLFEAVTLHPVVRSKTGEYETYTGYLLVRDGVIQAMGAGSCPEQYIGPETRRVSMPGAHLSPGWIDGHCHIGLDNEGLRWEGMDYNEMAGPLTPGVRAIDSIYPLDPAFEQARMAGVTSVMTGPGSANVVGGQFALIRTQGKRVDSMCIQQRAALKCAFGENPKSVYGQNKKSPFTRMGSAYHFRELFVRGQRYAQKRREEGENFERDLDLEPVADALERIIPVKIHAHRADDILTAVRLCEEFGLRYTLDHCTEGYRIVEELVEAYHSERAQLEGIFLGPLFGSRTKPELQHSSSGRNVATLIQAGLPVALITDHPVVMIDLLGVSAALTCRYGVKPEEALACITANPARILGETQRGFLAPQTVADLALFSGHPLAFDSRCLLTLVGGQAVYCAPELEQ